MHVMHLVGVGSNCTDMQTACREVTVLSLVHLAFSCFVEWHADFDHMKDIERILALTLHQNWRITTVMFIHTNTSHQSTFGCMHALIGLLLVESWFLKHRF